MDTAFHLANALSIGAFFSYGLVCLFADGMVDEFERYGLSRFRRLTGALEVLGALGLAGGYLIPVLTPLSGTGLALLMVLGLGVRLKVRDPWYELLPAALLLIVNTFIVARAVGWAG